jgi:hypothetical protein
MEEEKNETLFRKHAVSSKQKNLCDWVKTRYSGSDEGNSINSHENGSGNV